MRAMGWFFKTVCVPVQRPVDAMVHHYIRYDVDLLNLDNGIQDGGRRFRRQCGRPDFQHDWAKEGSLIIMQA